MLATQKPGIFSRCYKAPQWVKRGTTMKTDFINSSVWRESFHTQLRLWDELVNKLKCRTLCKSLHVTDIHFQLTRTTVQTPFMELKAALQVTKSTAFYGTPVFGTEFIKAHPRVLILSQSNPLNALPTDFLTVNFSITLPSTLRSSQWFFSPDFHTPFVLYWVTWITFG